MNLLLLLQLIGKKDNQFHEIFCKIACPIYVILFAVLGLGSFYNFSSPTQTDSNKLLKHGHGRYVSGKQYQACEHLQKIFTIENLCNL